MNKNQYFKQFANAYQRRMNKVLDKHYKEEVKEQKQGGSPKKKEGSPKLPTAKKEKAPNYVNMVLNHLGSKMVYRKQAPQLFHGVVDKKNKELAEGVKTFAKVPLPLEITRRKEVLEKLKR